MSTELITIALLIAAPEKSELVQLHSTLSEQYETQGNSEFPAFTPHLTLYQAVFPSESVNTVLTSLATVAKVTTRLAVLPAGISIKNCYIAIKFEKNPLLLALHKKTLALLNPFRNGEIKASYKDEKTVLTEAEKTNIVEWGYPYVLDLYQPHATIVKLLNKEDVKSASKIIEWQKNVTLYALVAIVTPVGKNTSNTKTIHSFPLL